MTEKPKIENLIRRHLSGMTGYAPATNPETLEGKIDVPLEDIVKLDANENPYGCSPRVEKRRGRRPAASPFTRTPGNGNPADAVRIRRTPPESIVAGAGSDGL
jgi:histidinol-phosphate aminotransferase